MKKISILIVLTLLFILSGIFSQPLATEPHTPIYPGKTISYGSTFTAGIPWPLQEGWSSGGSVQAGFFMKDIFPALQLGISGGYNFLLQSGEPKLFSNAGVSAHYSFPFLGIFSLNPEAGFSVAFPHNFGDAAVIPVIEGGFAARIQLSNRNFLSFDAALKYPVGGELPLQAVLSLSLSRFTAVKIEMKPVEVEFNIGPDRFSPDADEENDFLEIEMRVKNGNNIADWDVHIIDEFDEEVVHWKGGTSPPLQLRWDGYSEAGVLVGSAMYYTVYTRLTDILGNSFEDSREILTDILVRKVDGKYKIMIPNIVFPPNSADFSLLPEADLAKNTEIIRKIAVKLEKYPEYNVRIEGHGNLDYWRDPVEATREQLEVLLPLTEARAEMIKEVLIQSGIAEARLETIGIGGSEPIFPFDDKENRWKNRRVEFILLK